MLLRAPCSCGARLIVTTAPSQPGNPSAEVLIDQKDELRLLDTLLDAMPDDLRTVFVLHHIEEQTGAQIAEVLGIPLGTATSRDRERAVGPRSDQLHRREGSPEPVAAQQRVVQVQQRRELDCQTRLQGPEQGHHHRRGHAAGELHSRVG
jgi:hypothetical protein